MNARKRLLLVGPAVAAFVWWLLTRGPDVDAWTIHRDDTGHRPPSRSR